MRKNFWTYYWDTLHNFGEATINFFIFLPYFFSISTLFRTLLAPWKNLVVKKTAVGFSFSDALNRFAFNIISRSVGLVMRLSIISFYFIIQTLMMILLPFVALSLFLFTPFFYLAYLTKKTPLEEKASFKEDFIKKHLLNHENYADVEYWFETYYDEHLRRNSWWKLSNLFSYPPLARDWAVGYTPILDGYSIDLATATYLSHIKNIIGREKEISEIEQILTKSIDNSLMIVGGEGVGKHTIVDALAKKIYLGKTNSHLMYRRILKLNMEKILNEFTDQKKRENFFEELLKEAELAKNIILVIENIDKYTTIGENKIDLTNSIEKYIKSNSLQIVGITNTFAYQNLIYTNEKISHLFNKIEVYEISKLEAEKILLENVYFFENLYQVNISYEAVIEAVEKSEFYLTSIPFPEKAVDLLDSACVYITQNGTGGTDRSRPVPTTITPKLINTVLTEKTHIPTLMTREIKEKLLNLETLLFSKIIQQDEAIRKLSSTISRSFLLIAKRKKPLASFLFLGPTGVGKTETAKAIADVFFSETTNFNEFQRVSTSFKYLIRFDMSEFQSKYDIPKLIGDASSTGLLTNAIRKQNYGVLLLDEIEKANKDLLNIFLTVIDEGYLTDGTGNKIDCKNLIIIATSNAKDENYFPPEFLNRFDGIIKFQSLSPDSIKKLSIKMIEKISLDIFKLYKVKLIVSDVTIDLVSKKGYDPKYGARNLERTIRTEIEDKVVRLILEDKKKAGDTINL